MYKVSLQDALGDAPPGERVDVQSLQFGQNRHDTDERVAGGWRGVGLEPPADGEESPLHFG